jgi:UDP-glucose 4-epimerase
VEDSLHIIAGGSGFIGSHLTNFLIEKGSSVISLDRNQSRTLRATNYFELVCDINIERDLIIETICELYPSKRVTIWHLAANSDILRGMKDPKIELNDTFMTTISLCEIAKALDCKKMIFASTSAVYGYHPNSKLIEGETELNPISYYGALKVASESYLKAYAHESDSNLHIYRFPNVIGEDMTHGLLYDLPRKINHELNQVEILGNGNQKKPYLNVDDLITLIYRINKISSKKINLFNLGPNDDGIKINEIIKMYLKKNYPLVTPIFGDSESGWIGDVPTVNLSIEKLKKVIPNHTLTSMDAVMKTLGLN